MPEESQPAEPTVHMLAPVPEGPQRQYKRGLSHGLLIGGAVALVMTVVLVVLLVTDSGRGTGGQADASIPAGEEFRVDGCVKQEAEDAVAIDCADAGVNDYRITAEVDDSRECPDQDQPVVKTDGDVYCLTPFKR